MYLTLQGSRRSGKTTALVDAAKNYLESNPTQQICVLTPVSAQQRYIQEIFAKKVNPHDLVRVTFSTGGRVSTAQFGAYFVDEKNYMRPETMNFLETVAQRGEARLYQTMSVE